MVKFIIVRHGYSAGNKEKRFSGQLDSPLDQIGLIQAQCVSEYIFKAFSPDAIYSSDSSRAYQTIKPLADKLGMTITTCKELREIDVGDWQGILVADIERLYPEKLNAYRTSPGLFRFDGGESYRDMMERGRLSLERIAQQNEGKTVVVATHGGIIRTLLALWNGIPIERISEVPIVPNASVTIVTYDNGKVTQLEVGYTDHLDDITEEEVAKTMH